MQMSHMHSYGIGNSVSTATFSTRADLSMQESTAGAATAPWSSVAPAAATSLSRSGSNQQVRQQQHQFRPLAQTSMQAFMAARSGRADTQQAWQHQAAPASVQQQAQHAVAAGANADGSSFIDLTSDPHPTAAAMSVPGDIATTTAVSARQAQASYVNQEPAGINFFEDAVDDDDDVGTDGLMECSTNLLNAGIRVHKYSIVFCCQSCPPSCCVPALRLHPMPHLLLHSKPFKCWKHYLHVLCCSIKPQMLSC